jgi:hypothetical protein
MTAIGVITVAIAVGHSEFRQDGDGPVLCDMAHDRAIFHYYNAGRRRREGGWLEAESGALAAHYNDI